jgi:hypothetical protein
MPERNYARQLSTSKLSVMPGDLGYRVGRTASSQKLRTRGRRPISRLPPTRVPKLTLRSQVQVNSRDQLPATLLTFKLRPHDAPSDRGFRWPRPLHGTNLWLISLIGSGFGTLRPLSFRDDPSRAALFAAAFGEGKTVEDGSTRSPSNATVTPKIGKDDPSATISRPTVSRTDKYFQRRRSSLL